MHCNISFSQETSKEVCNLLPLCPKQDFSQYHRINVSPAVQSPDSSTTFSIAAFYLSSRSHTFPISSLLVVSNGFVIKSTALVQQVIRSENTAWAALSVSVMS